MDIKEIQNRMEILHHQVEEHITTCAEFNADIVRLRADFESVKVEYEKRER